MAEQALASSRDLSGGSRRARSTQILARGLLYLVLIAMGVAVIYPFLWMILATFKTTSEIFSLPPSLLPKKVVVGNYVTAFTHTSVIRWFMNSLYVTGTRVILSLFLCSLAGFAFAKYNFRFRTPLFLILIASFMIPFQVILIPLYVLMVQIRWVDSYLALWVPWMASPFGIFLMRQYIVSLPDDLLDAARIDGASEFRIYWQIVLPLTKPALGALATIIFLQQWTNFLWPLIILNSESKYTLPLGVATLMSSLQLGRIDWGVLMVIAALTTLPILCVFFVMQKQFIAGLTLGSVKG
jgi:ABC-type glycerol-3-phosphate transport system permease component